MNSIDTIKFKKLVSSEWLKDEEANFVLSILNKKQNLQLVFEELVKMSSTGTSSVPFFIVKGNTLEQHFTKSTSVLSKIANVILSESDIDELKGE